MLSSAGIDEVVLTQNVPASDSASGDTALPYVMPEAEYMYGCVATSVGMLLGYYDLYGYVTSDGTYRFNNLIPGTISIDSRGSDDGSIYDMKDPSVLAKFIASTEYVKRFYGTTPAAELPYTFVNSSPAQGLNTSVWNCLADYLGTGQHYRYSSDLSTSYYYETLAWCKSTAGTLTIDTLAVPCKYIDFKYGLSLYVESVGYKLNETATRTVKTSEFSFDDYMAEIDAGRPVLLSLRSDKGGGHMVVGYGYNAGTHEIIFDDTYRTDCRMNWSGGYEYSDDTFKLNAATTVVFDTSSMTPDSSIPPGTISGATVSTYGTVSGSSGYLAPAIVSGGTLNVVSGGTVDLGTVSSGGWMNVMTAGSASRTAVEKGGRMWVGDGGTAVSTGVAGSFFLGGTASATTVSSGGAMYVSSGGAASGTTVKNGGMLYLSGGGTLSGGVVSSGGSAVLSGGTLSGTWDLYGTVRPAAAVNASGASIRFHLENSAAPGTYFIAAGSGKGLAGLADAAFTIVVDNSPAFGTFRLAEGASGFTGSVTLCGTAGNTLGSLTVSGAVLPVAAAGYQLLQSGGALTLKVSDLSVPPEAPTVQPSATAPTNKNVVLTATYSADTVTKQYSWNQSAWKSYSDGGITVSSNTTCYFRGLNAAGVASPVTAYTVSNIDKTPPAAPTVQASATAPTNKNVVLTATFSSDAKTKQYSLNNTSWVDYTKPVTVRLNNSVCRFRSVDAAGNASVTSYTVKNIDRTPPAAPTVKKSTTARTENPVTMTATYSSDTATKQFSLDGRNWLDYLGPVSVTVNGTWYFRGLDAAGNVSPVTACSVDNVIVVPAPQNLTAKVSKYNVSASWAKIAPGEKGVKVKYLVKVDGTELAKPVTGTRYTLKNASVGSHAIAVRGMYLYKDGRTEYSNWRTVSAKVTDITAPKLGKITASVSGYTGTIVLDASDNVGVKKYAVTLNGVTKTVTGSSVKFTGLAIGKLTAAVVAFDAAGNASKVRNVKLTVKDATPPGKVTGVNAVSGDKGKAALSWDAVSDNSGLPVSYEVELSTGKIVKSKTNTCSVKLKDGKYTYRVRAIDKAKNVGAWSTKKSFSIGAAVASAANALSYCDTLRLDSALRAAADACSLTASAVKEQGYLAAL